MSEIPHAPNEQFLPHRRDVYSCCGKPRPRDVTQAYCTDCRRTYMRRRRAQDRREGGALHEQERQRKHAYDKVNAREARSGRRWRRTLVNRAFATLTTRGVNGTEIARLLSVNRDSVYKWRSGHTLPTATNAERLYRLAEIVGERDTIEIGLEVGSGK